MTIQKIPDTYTVNMTFSFRTGIASRNPDGTYAMHGVVYPDFGALVWAAAQDTVRAMERQLREDFNT